MRHFGSKKENLNGSPLIALIFGSIISVVGKTTIGIMEPILL